MGAAAKYPTPLVQLRELLIDARARGLAFEEAWARAMRPGKSLVMTTSRNAPADCIRWPTDRDDRNAWTVALHDSREGWRRAYERERPTPPEQAIVLLAPALSELSDELAAAEREGMAPASAVA